MCTGRTERNNLLLITPICPARSSQYSWVCVCVWKREHHPRSLHKTGNKPLLLHDSNSQSHQDRAFHFTQLHTLSRHTKKPRASLPPAISMFYFSVSPNNPFTLIVKLERGEEATHNKWAFRANRSPCSQSHLGSCFPSCECLSKFYHCTGQWGTKNDDLMLSVLQSGALHLFMASYLASACQGRAMHLKSSNHSSVSLALVCHLPGTEIASTKVIRVLSLIQAAT